jgi:hypothetical protein
MQRIPNAATNTAKRLATRQRKLIISPQVALRFYLTSIVNQYLSFTIILETD